MPSFRALLVEDNAADAYLVRKLLCNDSLTQGQFGSFQLDSVATLESALGLLDRQYPDAVLLDLSLPDSSGVATLRALRRAAPELPIVVLTGSSEEALGIEALSLGAQDFLSKDQLDATGILRSLRYSIERCRSEVLLLAALREKEVLLRELNHRAKNNLQVVLSLLAMQARRSQDEAFRALVGTARERIDSMALAHEQLDRSLDLSRVDFSAYLKTLAEAVHRSHGGAERNIEVCFELAAVTLPLDRAVTAGLLVNELLTNAFKHAFPGERRGTVRLSVREADSDTLVLRVEDNGIGAGLAASAPAGSLGLELVKTFAAQLQAGVECDVEHGTTFTLSFSTGQPT